MSERQKFSEKLKEILDEKGITTEPKLVRLVQKARSVSPDLSIQRLINLRRGSLPTPKEIQALAVGLGVHPREFITDQDSVQASNYELAIDFASNRMETPDLAEDFAQYVSDKANFRAKTLGTDDLYQSYHQFLDERYDDET